MKLCETQPIDPHITKRIISISYIHSYFFLYVLCQTVLVVKLGNVNSTKGKPEVDIIVVDVRYVLPPLKTPVTPEWRPYSVPTAFEKIAERRAARCANASNAVQTLWKRCAIA